MNTFYRVSNIDTNQGLWYDFAGTFTGNIYEKYKFCKCNTLAMEFDEEIVGWISVTPTLEDLYEWFPKEDIIELQKDGYFITEYYAEDIKFYERFQHYIIKQDTSILVKHLVLEEESELIQL